MKEIFRHHEIIYVKQYQEVLEAAGIPTMIRNEMLAYSGITEVPIPEMYPNLCVDDEHEEVAIQLISDHVEKVSKGADETIVCPQCSEQNPGNFEFCFACETPFPQT